MQSERNTGGNLSYWWAHVFLLWGLAVAQPIYDLLGRYPEFFVARQTVPLELYLLALVVSIMVPALAALALLTLRLLWARGFPVALKAVLAVLATAVLLPIVGRLPLPAPAVAALAAAGGVGAALAYCKASAVRLFLSFLSPAVLIFPLYFLFATPVQKLAVPSNDVFRAVERAAPDGGLPSIVMIVFDELALDTLLDGQGRVDEQRFPNFARLAARSTWFRNATTVAEATHQAVPAIATGLYPEGNKLGNSRDYPDSLFTWLAPTHRLAVFESITQLCPVQLCEPRVRTPWRVRAQLLTEDLLILYGHLILPRPWTGWLPAVDHGWGNFRRDDWQLERSRAFYGTSLGFEQLLEEIGQRGGEPTLYFFHTALPHFPWVFLPSGRRYSWQSLAEVFLRRGSWSPDPLVVAYAFQRYLLQLGFTDRQLGRLLDGLEASGRDRDTLLVVMADHGVSFVPGGPRRRAASKNVQEVMRVPLFVRAPGLEPGRVSELNAETVDLLPTLSELLQLPLPWQPDGRTLLGREADKPHKRLYKQSVPTPFLFAADLRTRFGSSACVDGRLLLSSPGEIVGSVDSVTFEGEKVVLSGFSADLVESQPADRVLVFVDGVLVHSGGTGLLRKDVVTFFDNPRLLESGFRHEVPRSLFEARPNPRVRFFGVRGSSLSELRYQDGYPWQEAGPEPGNGPASPRDCGPDASGYLIERAALEAGTPAAESEFQQDLRRRALAAGGDLVMRPQRGSRWLGVPLAQVPDARPAAARLRFPNLYESVNPEGGFVPAEVDAVLEDGGDTVVLVALNGIVRAAARPFRFDGQWRILALVAEQHFQDGENRVEFARLD